MSSFRRRIALAICPELSRQPLVVRAPMRPSDLVRLSFLMECHLGVTHWAVSMRVASKGDLIDRFKAGGDARSATIIKALQRFSDIWPTDLEWPSDIPRPDPSQEAVR